jgi:hypothetical protein
MPPSAKRGWWRAFFHDHPGYATKAPESTDSGGKAKVWCMQCFETRIAGEIASDKKMVIAGTREAVRSRDVIEGMGLYSSHEQESHVDLSFLIVWVPGQMDPTRGWLISRTTTLTCHLHDCELQPAAIRANAAVECGIATPSHA